MRFDSTPRARRFALTDRIHCLWTFETVLWAGQVVVA